VGSPPNGPGFLQQEPGYLPGQWWKQQQRKQWGSATRLTRGGGNSRPPAQADIKASAHSCIIAHTGMQAMVRPRLPYHCLTLYTYNGIDNLFCMYHMPETLSAG